MPWAKHCSRSLGYTNEPNRPKSCPDGPDILLGRIGSKPRQGGGGRHVSPTITQPS